MKLTARTREASIAKILKSIDEGKPVVIITQLYSATDPRIREAIKKKGGMIFIERYAEAYTA
jgi:hypothetical protein